MNASTSTDRAHKSQLELGRGILRLRLSQNLPQLEAARLAGVSERAWRNLENGRGSTVETVLRALDVLGSLNVLDPLLAPPRPPGQEGPRRASRRRKRPSDQPVTPE